MKKNPPPDFQTLFESAPSLFLVLELSFKIVAVSDAYLNATMTKREDIIGRNIFDVFPDNPEDQQATGVHNLRLSLERVLINRTPDTMAVQKYDIRRPTSEGAVFEERFWSPINTPVFAKDGSIIYIIHRVDDVTEFMRLKKRGTEQNKLTKDLRSQVEHMAAEVYERAHQLQVLNKKLTVSNESLLNKEIELKGLYDRLLKLDHLKTQFFANVSHELRTPLTLILGPIKKILSSRSLLSHQEKDLKIVERNAHILLKHVNDLLDISKLDAGKMSIQYQDVDLAALVRQTSSNFEALAIERQLTFLLDTPESLRAQVDPEKFQRILLNLLSNAFKFTPPAGIIRCSLSIEGKNLALTVADSGPGIPENLKEAIFNRFFQAEDSSTRTHGGTGLGLTIVKEFVSLHEGIIKVKSASEGGAEFAITFPFKAPSDQVSHSSELDAIPKNELFQQYVGELRDFKPEPQPQRSSRNLPLVLVVEDNLEMNNYICEFLAPDYRVESALNGIEGLEKSQKLHPDIILSDLMMPLLNGSQMLEKLKSTPDLSLTPVIILSARLDDELRISTLQQGAYDYVVKPFSAEEVKVRVHNALMMKKSRELLQQELTSNQQNLIVLTEQITHQSHELRQSLELTKAAMDEASRASQVKTQFLANMSHEIRTPLGIILGFAEILANPSLSSTERSEYLMKMRQNGQHLLQLLSDILDVAKIEAGQLEVENDIINLEDLIEELSSGFEERARNKGLTFKIFQERQVPARFRSDLAKLRQILINLIDNAIKFSQKGIVEVFLGAKPENSPSELIFQVKDQGPGISSEYQSHLFEIFSQENGELTRKFGGIGLGLALSYRLATALGGKLELGQTSSEGTVFNFKMPLIPIERVASTGEEEAKKVVSLFTRSPGRGPLEGIRVLIVDDSKDIQVVLSQTLQNVGAVTANANNGIEGVKKGLSNKYDIILMDMQMPDMDGYQATAVLRSKGMTIPIIAVTAHALRGDRERCLEAGCDEYLAKPVDKFTLVKTIHEHLYISALRAGEK